MLDVSVRASPFGPGTQGPQVLAVPVRLATTAERPSFAQARRYSVTHRSLRVRYAQVFESGYRG